MIEKVKHENRNLTFVRDVSLDDYSKSMKHFNKLFRIYAGRDAKYQEFTQFLIDNDFVTVGEEIKE